MDITVFSAFLCYFFILVSISVSVYILNKKSSDFTLGGRSTNYLVTGISAHASEMSDWLFMGYPAMVYSKGLMECWTAIGLTIFMFLNWHFIAKKLRVATEKYQSLTISSFFEKRFGDTSGAIRIIAACLCLIFFTYYISAILVGVGRLFEAVLGINYFIGISLGIMVVCYTLIGGFTTMVWIDLFQGLFLLSVLLIVPLLALVKVGGFGSIVAAADARNISLSLFPSFSLSTIRDIVFPAAGWGLGYCGLPHLLTKFMAIDDPNKIVKAKWIGISWQILILTAASLVAVVGLAFFQHGLAKPELIFVEMVQNLFSPFFAAFVSCAVIAAAINVMGAQIFVSASVITEDFCRKIFLAKKGISEKRLPQMLTHYSRISLVLLCSLAYGIAIFTSDSIYNLVYYAWAGLGSSFGPLLIVSLYTKACHRNTAIVGMLSGGITAGLWTYFNTSVPSMFPGYAMSLGAMFLVEKITSPK